MKEISMMEVGLAMVRQLIYEFGYDWYQEGSCYVTLLVIKQ
jgi:hypothetical protein